ncbi:type II secretion system protein XpsI [Lysobacter fragariae]
MSRTGRARRRGRTQLPTPRACTGAANDPRLSSRTRRAQGGYTLLEVIVAFALLAAALTLLLGTLSGAARQVRNSADAGRAALHAQSLLAGVGVGQALKAGSDSGDFEGGTYRWQLVVRPWTDPTQPRNGLADLAAPQLMEVAVNIEWGDGGPRRRLQLRTLRLVPADAGIGP